MRLVADESCDFAVVSAVCSAGHDVLSITEGMSGAEDEQVIKLAATGRRLLLMEDKDFGQLVFYGFRRDGHEAQCTIELDGAGSRI